VTGTRAKVAKHEKRCYMNPNRVCDACGNTGIVMEDVDGPDNTYTTIPQPCPYCSKFDPKIKEGIEEYRKELEEPVKEKQDFSIPF
jgi:hypothetical protein